MHSENLRGIALMITAMAFFALTDTFVKLSAALMPVGQVMLLLGAGGGAIFIVLTALRGQAILSRDFLHPGVLLRNGCEIVGTFSFVTALSTVGISVSSAVLQATPLAVTLGAALILREHVGWRRWSAILIGFAGVLVILRPGLSGFDINTLWAVVAMLALGLRDLATRLVPPDMPSRRIGIYGMAMLGLGGAILLGFGDGPVPLGLRSGLYMAVASGLGAIGYYSIVLAMRMGDVSVVAPFRYARIFFALAIGSAVFGERPDAYTYLGAAITIAAGIYTFLREARLTQQGQPS